MELPSPNTDVASEIRKKALQRTTAILKELNRIREELSLPVAQLPIVIDMYNTYVSGLIAEALRDDLEKNQQRLPMKMQSLNHDGSPRKIQPGQTIAVSVRPRSVFRVEDISIQGDPTRWRIHDITVGHRSQIVNWNKPGAIPGNEFGPHGVLAALKLETLQPSMDFALLVEYLGFEIAGEVFEAVAVGTAS